MINSAEEFYQLRTSENPEEYLKAAWDEAKTETWLEIIKNYPDMAFWVAQNKTVSNEILGILTDHEEWRVRSMIASKNKITEEIQMKLALDHEALVRSSIARNKKVTLKILQMLRDDEDVEIREIVKQRISERKYK
ncbi:hypothetical protein [Paenibacillus glycanilyticus]|uniref:hypothetical protein n=1 Tax=Paenibacillus glycanilyticus TaxID=126569 RepID=UPI003EB99187